MNVSELLKPLVEKAIASKGYSREQAVEKAHIWLAKELGVAHAVLYNLDYEQQWLAECVVQKAMAPPAKKHKRRMEPPKDLPLLKELTKDFEPMGTAFWLELQKIWGTEFYCQFFGDWTDVKVEGTLAPGQFAMDEIKKVNRTALFDAA